jgi:hypothetical protein
LPEKAIANCASLLHTKIKDTKTISGYFGGATHGYNLAAIEVLQPGLGVFLDTIYVAFKEEAYTQQGRAHSRRLHPDWAARPRGGFLRPHSSFFEVFSPLPYATTALQRGDAPHSPKGELAAPVIEWVRNVPGTECNMSNGRGGLLDRVKNFYAANLKPGKTDAQLAGVISGLLSTSSPSRSMPSCLGNLAMSQAIESNSFAIYIGTTARTLKEEDLRFVTTRGAQDQRSSRSGRVVYIGRRNRPVLVNPNTGMDIPMKEARGDFGALYVTPCAQKGNTKKT